MLKKLGITVLDWTQPRRVVQRVHQRERAANDGAVLNEFNALQEKYKAKYATVKSDADIAF